MELSKEFIAKQQAILLNEKKRLELEIAKLKKYPNYDEGIGEDGMQEIVDFENNVAIDETLELVLEKVKKALKAIENGTYGKCTRCSANIESGRLDIMPYADVCVTCDGGKK